MNKEAMTPYERLMGVFNHQPVDRVPVVPSLREWCVRQVGFKFSELMTNPAKHVYSQYYCARTFGTDAVFDLWGVHTEAEAMGSVLKIPDDEKPSVDIPAIESYEKNLSKLKILDPTKDGRIPFILEGIRNLKTLSGGEFPVVAYLNAPFRLASMLRGGGSMVKDCLEGNKHLEEFLELCTNALIVYSAALIQAGADLLWISDPTSSGDKVSKETWLTYGLPYTKKVVKAIKHHGKRSYMHICGDTTDRLDTFVETGVDGVSLSEKVDLAHARKVMGEDMIIWGNVDFKNASTASRPKEIEEEARIAIEKGRGEKGNFVLATGCITLADMAVENVKALVAAAHKYGQYT
jgi:uroporphyrinogen decarboxylase